MGIRALAVIASSLFVASSLCACGGGGGAENPPPVSNVTPGGIWTGSDSNGRDVAAVVTETGRFHFLIFDDRSQGVGVLSVSNGNDLSGNYQLVTQPGFVFSDGTTLASCSLAGTVNERQSVAVTTNCTTTAGAQFQTTAALNYDNLYDRDSSLATISGNYQGVGSVLNIAGDGTIFAQDPLNGCVINGQVQLVNSSFNVYGFEYGYGSCEGEAAFLNGTFFDGLAVLDNTVSPEELVIGVTGSVEGILVSLIQAFPRT